jgi:hypothetical protein
MPSFHNPVATSTFIINKKFLLPSFHSPWIIVTITNYIDNKRNSIAIYFLCCHKYSGWSGWVHFFLATIITIREGLGFFFLIAIKTVGDGIYLRFLSQCSDEKEQQFIDKGWDFDVLELACLLYKQLVQRITRALQQIHLKLLSIFQCEG